MVCFWQQFLSRTDSWYKLIDEPFDSMKTMLTQGFFWSLYQPSDDEFLRPRKKDKHSCMMPMLNLSALVLVICNIPSQNSTDE